MFSVRRVFGHYGFRTSSLEMAYAAIQPHSENCRPRVACRAAAANERAATVITESNPIIGRSSAGCARCRATDGGNGVGGDSGNRSNPDDTKRPGARDYAAQPARPSLGVPRLTGSRIVVDREPSRVAPFKLQTQHFPSEGPKEPPYTVAPRVGVPAARRFEISIPSQLVFGVIPVAGSS